MKQKALHVKRGKDLKSQLRMSQDVCDIQTLGEFELIMISRQSLLTLEAMLKNLKCHR